MRIFTLTTILAMLALGPAWAQDQFTKDTKSMWDLVKGNVLKAAEKMPEENWSYRPVPEVRTFGQIVAHVADANNSFCSVALGEKRPEVRVEQTMKTKAEITAALKASMDFCDKAFVGMNDAKGAETVKFMGDRSKLGVLNFNAVHDMEHYGNLVTYMRAKGIVPPSSEPRK